MLRTITRCFGRHLWLAGTVLVMAVWTLRLLALHYTPNTCYAITCNNYISDQVGAQNLIADWQQGFRQASDLGPQMDFLKYPLYLAVNNLPIEPLKQLFIESWLILAVTAALVLRAMELVFGVVAERTATPKRLPVSMLVVTVALAATPVAEFYWLEFPDSRNVEIGLCVFLIRGCLSI